MPRLSHKPMKARKYQVNLASAPVTRLPSARMLQPIWSTLSDHRCRLCCTYVVTCEPSEAAELVVPNTKYFCSLPAR